MANHEDLKMYGHITTPVNRQAESPATIYRDMEIQRYLSPPKIAKSRVRQLFTETWKQRYHTP